MHTWVHAAAARNGRGVRAALGVVRAAVQPDRPRRAALCSFASRTALHCVGACRAAAAQAAGVNCNAHRIGSGRRSRCASDGSDGAWAADAVHWRWQPVAVASSAASVGGADRGRCAVDTVGPDAGHAGPGDAAARPAAVAPVCCAVKPHSAGRTPVDVLRCAAPAATMRRVQAWRAAATPCKRTAWRHAAGHDRCVGQPPVLAAALLGVTAARGSVKRCVCDGTSTRRRVRALPSSAHRSDAAPGRCRGWPSGCVRRGVHRRPASPALAPLRAARAGGRDEPPPPPTPSRARCTGARRRRQNGGPRGKKEVMRPRGLEPRIDRSYALP
jgi:hypothetical protein